MPPRSLSIGCGSPTYSESNRFEPELLIAIKDHVFVRGFKVKRLAQLLDDPIVRRMLRDVDVQDASPIMTDDKKAVEHAEDNRWHAGEIHGRNCFPMISKEGQPALDPVSVSRRSFHPTGDGFLGKINRACGVPHGSAALPRLGSQ
jgi:hypothetical protein